MNEIWHRYKVVIGLGLLFTSVSTNAQQVKAVDFNRDIRPILSNHCYTCHGPDEATLEAELRLDDMDGIIAGDGGLIVPGDAASSEIYLRVNHHDESERMPPSDAPTALTQDQINLIQQK